MGYFSGPKIVTDGLVFAVDAASARSYPGSGTTATSLKGGVNGTLRNGVTFDSADEGSWEFDGVDQSITVPLVETFTTALTVETWYKSTDQTRSHLWNFGTENSNGLFMNINDSGQTAWIFWLSGGGNALKFSTPQLMDGEINQIVFVHEGSTNKLYFNGVLLTPSSSPGTQSFSGLNSTYNIGGTSFFDGNVYANRVYKASLTAAQVLQNYNALKSRFA